MKLEGIVNFGIKRKVVLGIFMTLLGCDYQTDQQECCQCLEDNQCVQFSKDRCLDVFQVYYGQDSIGVDGSCVKEQECYLPCSMAGAYFDKNRMIFRK